MATEWIQEKFTCFWAFEVFLVSVHELTMIINHHLHENTKGKLWCSWLRQCATHREVVGSIPDGVIENFSLT